MGHLRKHPSFQALPHPDTISEISCLENVRYFRQDSWQWDALHAGRCTTSQAAAALGLLEPQVGKALGIPRSLRRGGSGAYHRLRQTALRDLEEMNTTLCTGGSCLDRMESDEPVWIATRDNGSIGQPGRKLKPPHKFAARYLPRMTKEEWKSRRSLMMNSYAEGSAAMSARMHWGNTQEATSILTALNYFWRENKDIVIKEVGMCGAGLMMNSTEQITEGDTSILLGATPDAIIHYPNGTLEVLEVKNHCPFVPAAWGRKLSLSKGEGNKAKNIFRIRELPIQAEVPAAYIPQLMMEMLSMGPQCRSAVMVRQTATTGAVILRLHRDDQWISEMLYWLNRFMSDFVHKSELPPQNFFWNNTGCNGGGERYRSFISRTKKLSESVELIDFVSHGSIQRVVSADQQHIPLFFD